MDYRYNGRVTTRELMCDAMRSRKFAYALHKLKVSARLRCPECEQGRLFERCFRVFRMKKTCDYCKVRFERTSGDAIGGVYINVALAELTAMGGFFAVHALFAPPIMLQLFFWVPYVLAFCVLGYKPARGLWIGVMYLTGGIYADPDYQREYIAPTTRTYGRTPQENE